MYACVYKVIYNHTHLKFSKYSINNTNYPLLIYLRQRMIMIEIVLYFVCMYVLSIRIEYFINCMK